MIYELSIDQDAFNSINKGLKNTIVRLYTEDYQRMRPGETLVFRSPQDEIVRVKITSISIYSDFATLLDTVAFRKIRRRYYERAEDYLNYLFRCFPKEQRKKYCAVAISFL